MFTHKYPPKYLGLGRRVLGDEDGKWQLYINPQDAQSSLEDASVCPTQSDAIQWLSQYVEDVPQFLERKVYPNTHSSLKSVLLSKQWNIYVECLYGRRKYDDRDHVRAKRLDTAGAMLGTMFMHLFYQMPM